MLPTGTIALRSPCTPLRIICAGATPGALSSWNCRATRPSISGREESAPWRSPKANWFASPSPVLAVCGTVTVQVVAGANGVQPATVNTFELEPAPGTVPGIWNCVPEGTLPKKGDTAATSICSLVVRLPPKLWTKPPFTMGARSYKLPNEMPTPVPSSVFGRVLEPNGVQSCPTRKETVVVFVAA